MDIIAEADFDDFLSKEQGLVLVDFFAEWCGPCHMLSPILQSMAEQFPDITFVKVDVDQSQALAAAFGVQAMPTVVVLQPREGGGAAVLHSTVGVKPPAHWQDVLTTLNEKYPKKTAQE